MVLQEGETIQSSDITGGPNDVSAEESQLYVCQQVTPDTLLHCFIGVEEGELVLRKTAEAKFNTIEITFKSNQRPQPVNLNQ